MEIFNLITNIFVILFLASDLFLNLIIVAGISQGRKTDEKKGEKNEETDSI